MEEKESEDRWQRWHCTGDWIFLLSLKQFCWRLYYPCFADEKAQQVWLVYLFFDRRKTSCSAKYRSSPPKVRHFLGLLLRNGKKCVCLVQCQSPFLYTMLWIRTWVVQNWGLLGPQALGLVCGRAVRRTWTLAKTSASLSLDVLSSKPGLISCAGIWALWLIDIDIEILA